MMAEAAVVARQLGRPPRGLRRVAHRCPCGLPDVVETAPRLADGTPFPTLYYLTCPRAVAAVSRLEAGGTMLPARPGSIRCRLARRARGGCPAGSSACTRWWRTNSPCRGRTRWGGRGRTRPAPGGTRAPASAPATGEHWIGRRRRRAAGPASAPPARPSVSGVPAPGTRLPPCCLARLRRYQARRPRGRPGRAGGGDRLRHELAAAARGRREPGRRHAR